MSAAVKPLSQPWKEYLATKEAMEQSPTQKAAQKPDAEKRMCPGSEECGYVPHSLGTSAFSSHMACEVVMQGCTGASG